MTEILKSFIIKLTRSLSRNASFVILRKKLKLRAKSYFFILLFIAFLVTPPLVQILKAGDDNSSISFIEEENNTDGKFELEKKLEVFSKENFAIEFLEIIINRVQPYSSQDLAMSIYLDPVSPPPRMS
tara:strand:- start:1961 stop:2344 length:384 start_codon:yes stop_codon:yes gene_type:complete